MEINPYESPRAEAAMPPPEQKGKVPNKLRIPAMALIVLAGITIVACIGGIVAFSFMFATQSVDTGLFALMAAEYTAMIVSNVLVAYGAQRARRATSYRWALAAAIISIIPILSPFGYLGIPFGIWLLIVLLRKDVKVCFQR